GEKKSNELGIYDMSGNVWEWCRDSCEWKDGVVTDTYGVVTDTYGVVTDTYKDGMVDPWNRSGSWRVIRGGGWCDRAEYCRSVGRFSVAPSARGSILGFRLALVPVQ
ncbi:MAG: SUMF1/EgtB/PvdO family nonheme iron enzyme, partial [Victivallales bacterium]|nr:SUMF1/EgtB/PvdO family nonheme iron enzyme [Victivallales bacterium]